MGQFFERFVTGKIFISKMKLILMSLLVLGPCYGMDAMFKKIMKQTAKHTFDAACFGETNKNNYDLAVGAAIEKCLQLAPAIDLINILSPSSPFTSPSPVSTPRTHSDSSRSIRILTSLSPSGGQRGQLTPKSPPASSSPTRTSSWSSWKISPTLREEWPPRLAT